MVGEGGVLGGGGRIKKGEEGAFKEKIVVFYNCKEYGEFKKNIRNFFAHMQIYSEI